MFDVTNNTFYFDCDNFIKTSLLLDQNKSLYRVESAETQ